LWLFGHIWRCFQHESSTAKFADGNLVDNRDGDSPQCALADIFGSHTAFTQSGLRIGLAAIDARFYSLQD
jgi:hypothetical protein